MQDSCFLEVSFHLFSQPSLARKIQVFRVLLTHAKSFKRWKTMTDSTKVMCLPLSQISMASSVRRTPTGMSEWALLRRHVYNIKSMNLCNRLLQILRVVCTRPRARTCRSKRRTPYCSWAVISRAGMRSKSHRILSFLRTMKSQTVHSPRRSKR